MDFRKFGEYFPLGCPVITCKQSAANDADRKNLQNKLNFQFFQFKLVKQTTKVLHFMCGPLL